MPAIHPVETLPVRSCCQRYGRCLWDIIQSVIIDMTGTTSDIALVRSSACPRRQRHPDWQLAYLCQRSLCGPPSVWAVTVKSVIRKATFSCLTAVLCHCSHPVPAMSTTFSGFWIIWMTITGKGHSKTDVFFLYKAERHRGNPRYAERRTNTEVRLLEDGPLRSG